MKEINAKEMKPKDNGLGDGSLFLPLMAHKTPTRSQKILLLSTSTIGILRFHISVGLLNGVYKKIKAIPTIIKNLT